MIGSTLRTAFVGLAATLLIGCSGGAGETSAGDPGPGTPPPPSSNLAPTISIADSFEVLVGRALTIAPRASDPDGDALVFSVANRPAWMSFSAETGALIGTPGAGDVGIYRPVIKVSDGRAHATDKAKVTVAQAAAGRATLSWEAPTLRGDGSPLTNLAGFRIYYGNSPDELRYVIEIADPGARSHVIEDLTVGNWFFAASACDTSGGESPHSSVASKTIA